MERGTTKQITFTSLLDIFKGVAASFQDYRTGQNRQYKMEEIALSAFSIFFTQSPSFLAYQTKMQQAKGKNNCRTIFKINEIPSDNQIRNIMDGVSPEEIYPAFNELLKLIDEAAILDDFRCVKNSLYLVLDGLQYFSSTQIHCKKCNQKKDKKTGEITYSHSAITPAFISPKYTKALAMGPEFIHFQDGNTKQDCERNAAKRWLSRLGETLSELDITIGGDDLYANQPFCEQILENEMNFLLTCKPLSHKWLYEWVDINEKENEVHNFTRTVLSGKKKHLYSYRYTENVPMRDSTDALKVNWLEVLVHNPEGKQLYQNSFITNHILDSDETVVELVSAGRARWKIENENNNTLKTKGYHLEHNFGHGDNNLSETLATLNILSFLFHTLLELCDRRYQLVRKTLPRRDMFFHDIRALTRYFIFDSWNHLMQTMLEGLELEDPG